MQLVDTFAHKSRSLLLEGIDQDWSLRVTCYVLDLLVSMELERYLFKRLSG